MFRLITNWRAVALYSVSMQMIYMGIALLVVPEVYYAMHETELISPYTSGFVGLALLIVGGIGRLVDESLWDDQTVHETRRRRRIRIGLFLAVLAVVFVAGCKPDDPRQTEGAQAAPMPATEAQFLAHAVPFVGKWEGLRLTAYRDIVGVWTVCYGETKGVRRGDSHTKAECDAMLARELIAYRGGLHRYLTAETKAERLPVLRDVAFTSLAYNVGISGAGKSTATRRLNDGDVSGACAALTWWNKAGGRVVRGLVNRRGEEQAMCLKGVA